MLRVLFLLALVVLLVSRKRASEAWAYFVGRPTPARNQLGAAALVLILVVAVRALVKSLLPYPLPLTVREVVDQCVIAPVNEEVLFRGVFLTILLQHLPDKERFAILLSALLFVSIHNFSGLGQALALLAQALLYGYGYARTQSVPFCVFCHALWNSFAFIPVAPNT